MIELTTTEVDHLLNLRAHDEPYSYWIESFADGLNELIAEKIKQYENDSKILDYLASSNQTVANVQLPKECVLNNLDSMRNAILECMEKHPI